MALRVHLQGRVVLLQRAEGLLQLLAQEPVLRRGRRQPALRIGADGGLGSGALGPRRREQGLLLRLALGLQGIPWPRLVFCGSLQCGHA